MDDKLIKEALSGSQTAYSELYTSLRPLALFLTHRTRVFSKNEEMIHECISHVIINLPKFQGKSSFKTWAYRVIFNYIAMELRRRGNKETVSLSEVNEDHNSNLSVKNDIDSHIFIEECFKALPSDKQVVFKMIVSGLTTEEMSIRLGITPKGARSRIYRTRKALKALKYSKPLTKFIL